jgi:Rieske Fe-S protein
VFLQTAGAAVAGSLVASCSGDPSGPGGGGTVSGTFRVALPAVGQTVAIGGGGAGGHGMADTRLSDPAVGAVSRRCTHQGCTIGLPTSPGGVLACPCHGSEFSVSGAVVSPPASASLPSYPATIEGNEVVVTVP